MQRSRNSALERIPSRASIASLDRPDFADKSRLSCILARRAPFRFARGGRIDAGERVAAAGVTRSSHDRRLAPRSSGPATGPAISAFTAVGTTRSSEHIARRRPPRATRLRSTRVRDARRAPRPRTAAARIETTRDDHGLRDRELTRRAIASAERAGAGRWCHEASRCGACRRAGARVIEEDLP